MRAHKVPYSNCPSAEGREGGGLWQLCECSAAMLLTAGSTRRTHRHGEAAVHSHPSPLSYLVEPVALIQGIIDHSGGLVEQALFSDQKGRT